MSRNRKVYAKFHYWKKSTGMGMKDRIGWITRILEFTNKGEEVNDNHIMQYLMSRESEKHTMMESGLCLIEIDCCYSIAKTKSDVRRKIEDCRVNTKYG